jgi:hypothetical protein
MIQWEELTVSVPYLRQLPRLVDHLAAAPRTFHSKEAP